MKKVVIIGGGLGGLALAACLRVRAAGRVEAVVYEQAEELREVGAGLAVWPNAGRVLERLGVFGWLRERSHEAPVGALRDWRGRELMKMVAAQGEVPMVFAHRAVLLEAVRQAVPEGWVRLGKRCVGVERGAEGVRARFGDGTVSEWGDGVVGAEGVRSVVRGEVLGDGEARYRGYVAWRGVAEHYGEEVVGETWGCGRRFGLIPLGAGRVAWWAAANDRSPEETLRNTPGRWKEEVLEMFGGWHAPIRQVVEGTAEEAVVCHAICDRAPVERWGEGAVTLLGDAAHPMTPNLGQGACMAMEDAAVLAHALDAVPGVETAFRVYEATRMERTGGVVRESLRFGRMGQWGNPVACAVRNWMVRRVGGRGVEEKFRGLWGYDAWDVPLVMPG
ncbi:MAG: FAD-dependent monooxygenase [Phycisphaerae bacterium]